MPKLSRRTAIELLAQAGPVHAVTAQTTSGIRIHAIQTGRLVLKSAHRAYRGPRSLRLPAILLDPTWTEPLPILAWLIEHPEGLIVIDAGERSAASEPETYLACNPELRWFVSRNFGLLVRPEEEIERQMQQLNLDPAAVRWLVQTHLHFDHVGGLGGVPTGRDTGGRTRVPKPAPWCRAMPVAVVVSAASSRIPPGTTRAVRATLYPYARGRCPPGSNARPHTRASVCAAGRRRWPDVLVLRRRCSLHRAADLARRAGRHRPGRRGHAPQLRDPAPVDGSNANHLLAVARSGIAGAVESAAGRQVGTPPIAASTTVD